MQATKNQLKSYRRQVIIRLAQSGNQRQGQIGQIAGVSQGMVSKVLSGYRKQGLAILQMGSPKGAVAKLSVDQLAQLPALLAKGAISYGFQGELWTRKRVGYRAYTDVSRSSSDWAAL